MIMDSAKYGRWMITFMKFGTVRVNDRQSEKEKHERLQP